MNSLAQKTLSTALVVVLATQITLGSVAESNVWDDRRHVQSGPNAAPQQVQLAQLPSDLLPALSSFSSLSSRTPQFRSRIQTSISSSALRPVLEALPEDVGTVRKIIESANSSGRVVIHIQDVHRNIEAQRHISQALQQLIDHQQVDLVALEGAFGSMDFKWIREYPHPGSVKAVADYLFKEKRIQGPVYTAFTSNRDIPRFVGVDEKQHYDANVKAYQASAPLVAVMTENLKRDEQILATTKARTFNQKLADFDRHVLAYRAGSMMWGDYVRFLSRQTADVPTGIKAFLTALEMETTLNFSQVEAERAEIIARLLRKLGPSDKDCLLRLSVAYRLGTLRQSEFYDQLEKLCLNAGLSLSAYPHLGKYIRYVLLAETLDVDAILRDVTLIEQNTYAALTRNDVEARLVAEGRRQYLIGKLLNFALTKEEWKEYKRTNDLASDGDKRSLVSFEQFYLEAEARDQAMAKNLENAMDASGAKVAVLVTGGFHSDGLLQRLKPKGFTVVSYVPKISKIEDQKSTTYLSVFTQEKTPLDKLFAGEKLFLAQPAQLADKALQASVGAYDVAIGAQPAKLPDFPLAASKRFRNKGSIESVAGEIETAEVKEKELVALDASLTFPAHVRAGLARASSAITSVVDHQSPKNVSSSADVSMHASMAQAGDHAPYRSVADVRELEENMVHQSIEELLFLEADYGFLPETDEAMQLVRERAELIFPSKQKPTIRILARSGEGINAYAFPDGTIVLSPEMVAFCKFKEQIDAVLLHEARHVEERHALRSATRKKVVEAIGSERSAEWESDIEPFWDMTDPARHTKPGGMLALLESLRDEERQGRQVGWDIAHGNISDRIINLKSVAQVFDFAGLDAELTPIDSTISTHLTALSRGGDLRWLIQPPPFEAAKFQLWLNRVQKILSGEGTQPGASWPMVASLTRLTSHRVRLFLETAQLRPLGEVERTRLADYQNLLCMSLSRASELLNQRVAGLATDQQNIDRLFAVETELLLPIFTNPNDVVVRNLNLARLRTSDDPALRSLAGLRAAYRRALTNREALLTELRRAVNDINRVGNIANAAQLVAQSFVDALQYQEAYSNIESTEEMMRSYLGDARQIIAELGKAEARRVGQLGPKVQDALKKAWTVLVINGAFGFLDLGRWDDQSPVGRQEANQYAALMRVAESTTHMGGTFDAWVASDLLEQAKRESETRDRYAVRIESLFGIDPDHLERTVTELAKIKRAFAENVHEDPSETRKRVIELRHLIDDLPAFLSQKEAKQFISAYLPTVSRDQATTLMLVDLSLFEDSPLQLVAALQVLAPTPDAYEYLIGRHLLRKSELTHLKQSPFADLRAAMNAAQDPDLGYRFFGVRPVFDVSQSNPKTNAACDIVILNGFSQTLLDENNESSFWESLDGFLREYPAHLLISTVEHVNNDIELKAKIVKKGLEFLKAETLNRNELIADPVRAKRLLMLSFLIDDPLARNPIQEVTFDILLPNLTERQAIDLIFTDYQVQGLPLSRQLLEKLERRLKNKSDIAYVQQRCMDMLRSPRWLKTAGRIVAADAALESFTHGARSLEFLLGFVNTRRSDEKLRKMLVDSWWETLRDHFIRSMIEDTETLIQQREADLTKVFYDRSNMLDIDFAKFFFTSFADNFEKEARDQWLDSMTGYEQKRRIEIEDARPYMSPQDLLDTIFQMRPMDRQVLLRKLLLYVLEDPSQRRQMLDDFFHSRVAANADSLESNLVRQVIETLVDVAPTDELLLVLTSLLRDAGEKPSQTGNWNTAITDISAQILKLLRTQIKTLASITDDMAATMDSDHLLDSNNDWDFALLPDWLKIPEIERVFLVDGLLKDVPFALAVKKQLIPKIHQHVEREVQLENYNPLRIKETLDLATRLRENAPLIPEKMAPMDLMIDVARMLGAPGVRFLQLLGQVINIPQEHREKFSKVYDRNEGQSIISALHTIETELPEFAERIVRFEKKLGGGSLYTVFHVVLDDGSEEVVRVLNPNAAYHAQRSIAIIRDTIEAMAKTDPVYGRARPLVDLLESWIHAELSDTTFDRDDKQFRKWDGWQPKNAGFKMSIKVHRTIPTGTVKVKRETLVRGKEFTALSSFPEAQRKEAVALGAQHYLAQILAPIRSELTGSRLLGWAAGLFSTALQRLQPILKSLSSGPKDSYVHSDISVGNLMITDDGHVDELDRGMYLKFSKKELLFFRDLIRQGSSPADQADQFVRWLESLPENNDVAQKKKTSAEELTKALVSVMNTKADMQVLSLDALTEIQSRGWIVPLRINLLFRNLNAWNDIAQQAGFVSDEAGSALWKALTYHPGEEVAGPNVASVAPVPSKPIATLPFAGEPLTIDWLYRQVLKNGSPFFKAHHNETAEQTWKRYVTSWNGVALHEAGAIALLSWLNFGVIYFGVGAFISLSFTATLFGSFVVAMLIFYGLHFVRQKTEAAFESNTSGLHRSPFWRLFGVLLMSAPFLIAVTILRPADLDGLIRIWGQPLTAFIIMGVASLSTIVSHVPFNRWSLKRGQLPLGPNPVDEDAARRHVLDSIDAAIRNNDVNAILGPVEKLHLNTFGLVSSNVSNDTAEALIALARAQSGSSPIGQNADPAAFVFKMPEVNGGTSVQEQTLRYKIAVMSSLIEMGALSGRQLHLLIDEAGDTNRIVQGAIKTIQQQFNVTLRVQQRRGHFPSAQDVAAALAGTNTSVLVHPSDFDVTHVPAELAHTRTVDFDHDFLLPLEHVNLESLVNALSAALIAA